MRCHRDFSHIIRRKFRLFKANLEEGRNGLDVGSRSQLGNNAAPLLEDKVLRIAVEREDLWPAFLDLKEAKGGVVTACLDPENDSSFQISFFASAASTDPG
jgi:hypothetical protein